MSFDPIKYQMINNFVFNEILHKNYQKTMEVNYYFRVIELAPDKKKKTNKKLVTS